MPVLQISVPSEVLKWIYDNKPEDQTISGYIREILIKCSKGEIKV